MASYIVSNELSADATTDIVQLFQTTKDAPVTTNHSHLTKRGVFGTKRTRTSSTSLHAPSPPPSKKPRRASRPLPPSSNGATRPATAMLPNHGAQGFDDRGGLFGLGADGVEECSLRSTHEDLVENKPMFDFSDDSGDETVGRQQPTQDIATSIERYSPDTYEASIQQLEAEKDLVVDLNKQWQKYSEDLEFQVAQLQCNHERLLGEHLALSPSVPRPQDVGHTSLFIEEVNDDTNFTTLPNIPAFLSGQFENNLRNALLKSTEENKDLKKQLRRLGKANAEVQAEAECHAANTLEMCRIERYLVKQYKEIYAWVQLVAEKIGSPVPSNLTLAAALDKLPNNDGDDRDFRPDFNHEQTLFSQANGGSSENRSSWSSVLPSMRVADEDVSFGLSTAADHQNGNRDCSGFNTRYAGGGMHVSSEVTGQPYNAAERLSRVGNGVVNNTGLRFSPTQIYEDYNDEMVHSRPLLNLPSLQGGPVQPLGLSHANPHANGHPPTGLGTDASHLEVQSTSKYYRGYIDQDVRDIEFQGALNGASDHGTTDDFLNDAWVPQGDEILHQANPGLQG